MNVFIAIAALVAVCIAAPPDATVLKNELENIGVDGYTFDVETSDGLKRTEQGVLNNIGTDKESLKVTGSIKWVDLDGTPYSLDFVADENGFQPTGAHLPH
ncbi:endocuticle structural protein SgAbd-6-like isoform X2 [Anoplophora glabripennis]|uniref:endocuticle structural protein SgAbd-6-like isoform X2 n=1 Tax=Anoplophora glabripennis TaxID=217634 RepID=UPI000C7688B2|nr:endocuticle structural protein SgAbd-6-like isoform X2 [Anoplophora glabripennis]